MKTLMILPVALLWGMSPGVMLPQQAVLDAPAVSIVSPRGGLVVFGPDVTFTIRVTNFSLAPDEIGSDPEPGRGHAHVFVNDVFKAEVATETFTVSGLGMGLRTVKVSLRHNDHAPLDPPVEASVRILVV